MKICFCKESPIDQTIMKLTSEMAQTPPDTEAYSGLAKNLEILMRAKSLETTQRVSPDAVLGVAANLATVLLIMNHEKLNVISTRAMTFVTKNRI